MTSWCFALPPLRREVSVARVGYSGFGSDIQVAEVPHARDRSKELGILPAPHAARMRRVGFGSAGLGLNTPV